MSWERPFDQPVPLPSGPPARTLRDAANYIKKLSETERDTPEWRLAIQMLIDAAEDRGPMLFAKVGIQRAVNPGRKKPGLGAPEAGAGAMNRHRRADRRFQN